MRRLLTTALAAALVGGVIGGLSLASASTSRDRHVRVMRVLEVQTHQAFVDVGKKGFSIGDQFMFTSVLKTLDGKRVVGHTSITCTATLGNRADCNGTGWLPGGSVRVGQTLANGPNSVLAVVGGTGRYQGAGGQVSVHSLSDTRSLDTIRIILPG
jgi:allene oxide cyclase